MDDQRPLLKHFLAALAYRTQKALRGAPPDFADFRIAPQVRTPHEVIRHMDSVLGYARTFFIGGEYRPPLLPDLAAAVAHFHETLSDVARHLELGTGLRGITHEMLLQGPFSDAMTHAGQLAMLRRLAGSPVPPENFVFAAISPGNLGPDQPPPVSPDRDWPEKLGLRMRGTPLRAPLRVQAARGDRRACRGRAGANWRHRSAAGGLPHRPAAPDHTRPTHVSCRE